MGNESAQPSGATRSALDTRAVRAQFPLLAAHESGKPPLAYLDSAATSQIPACVLEAMEQFETHGRANIHRGIYPLAEEATDAFERARTRIAAFFGTVPEATVMTHGATEALNLAILGWGRANLREDDLVLVDTTCHHAGIVPWQMLAEERGVRLAFIGVTEEGMLDASRYHALLDERPRAVCLAHVSNVTGLSCDVAALAREAHAAGAVVFADCAQAAGHVPVRLGELEADFAAVSAHKMHGPFGAGALLATPEALAQVKPVFGGGGMIARVTEGGYACTKAPECFEAGTPNIAGAIGFAAACDFVESIGLDAIEAHGRELCDAALSHIAELPDVFIVGSDEPGLRASIVSFYSPLVHPHDLAAALAERGVAVRAGHQCAMPLHRTLGLGASVRASFAVHSTEEEVARLAEGIAYALEVYSCGR